MSNVLIHSLSIEGHRLEYLHHIYEAASKREENLYFFVVPQSFNNKIDILDWPLASNIVFEYEDNIPNTSNSLYFSKYRCSNLRKYVKKCKIDQVVLIDLMGYLPFLPFLLIREIEVQGIIYNNFLYHWNSDSLKQKAMNFFKYSLLTRFSIFKKVLLLNDRTSSYILNRKYHTSKFVFLPDPVPNLPASLDSKDTLRKKYGLSCDKKVFLHPGGMLKYKGTLEILNAIDMLPEKYCNSISIVFAGRITDDIKEDFFLLYQKLKSKVELLLIEGFLSFKNLSELFTLSDYVMIPYKSVSQSSGIVGLSAYYKKPVVVAKAGLIGKIVKKNRLGFLLDAPTAEHIEGFFRILPSWKFVPNSYVKEHTKEDFANKLLDF